jgi:preprotein translocase SecE subunit
VGTLIRELTHASIYKRSQGRITRQVTFAAMAIGLALGCWRLHTTLKTWSPGFRFGLVEERATEDGVAVLKREDPSDARYSAVAVLDDAGNEVQRVAIPEYGKRRVEDKQTVTAGKVLVDWDNDATILGMLSYGLPALLLAGGVWVAYRLVNVPGFADFLIAVEAEVNKVSWPSRNELFRASVVVLITIFALAAVLALFDLFWRFVFTYVLRLF